MHTSRFVYSQKRSSTCSTPYQLWYHSRDPYFHGLPCPKHRPSRPTQSSQGLQLRHQFYSRTAWHPQGNTDSLSVISSECTSSACPLASYKYRSLISGHRFLGTWTRRYILSIMDALHLILLEISARMSIFCTFTTLRRGCGWWKPFHCSGKVHISSNPTSSWVPSSPNSSDCPPRY